MWKSLKNDALLFWLEADFKGSNLCISWKVTNAELLVKELHGLGFWNFVLETLLSFSISIKFWPWTTVSWGKLRWETCWLFDELLHLSLGHMIWNELFKSLDYDLGGEMFPQVRLQLYAVVKLNVLVVHTGVMQSEIIKLLTLNLLWSLLHEYIELN